jgi:hypothetical protein
MKEFEYEDLGLKSKIKYPFKGYMEKEGHFMKNWNRRYFILDDKSKSLTYFTDENCHDKRGEIFLSKSALISHEPDKGDRKFLLLVNGLKKGSLTSTYLSFPTKKEMDSWFVALNELSYGVQVSIPGIFPDPFRLETKMKIIYKTSDLTNSSTAPASVKRLPPTIEVRYLNPIKINLYFFF